MFTFLLKIKYQVIVGAILFPTLVRPHQPRVRDGELVARFFLVFCALWLFVLFVTRGRCGLRLAGRPPWATVTTAFKLVFKSTRRSRETAARLQFPCTALRVRPNGWAMKRILVLVGRRASGEASGG